MNSVRIACPHCQHQLKVGHPVPVGKRVSCPQCMTPFALEDPTPRPAAPVKPAAPRRGLAAAPVSKPVLRPMRGDHRPQPASRSFLSRNKGPVLIGGGMLALALVALAFFLMSKGSPSPSAVAGVTPTPTPPAPTPSGASVPVAAPVPSAKPGTNPPAGTPNQPVPGQSPGQVSKRPVGAGLVGGTPPSAAMVPKPAGSPPGPPNGGPPGAAPVAAAAPAASIPVNGNWPQFRGPHRDNISLEKGLLQQWPPGGQAILWKAKVA
jgi:hypothetical protein